VLSQKFNLPALSFGLTPFVSRPLQLPVQPPFGDQDYTNIDVIFMVICRRIFRPVCRRGNEGVSALGSVRLHDQEAVVGVAEEELRRHGIGHGGLN
jgi:hypothetical protein